MPAQMHIRLNTPVAAIPGVGEKRAAGFRRLGIRCVADLLRHLPMRYEHEMAEQSIDTASRQSVSPNHLSSANLAVQGEIMTTRSAAGRRPRFEATLFDGTGTMLLTWFNAPWMRKKLHPGMSIRAWGKTKRWGDYLQMVNPNWEPLDPEQPSSPREARIRPIYPGSEEVPSSLIDEAIEAVLEPALSQLDDHLHEAYRRRRSLPALAEAYRMVHRPQDENEAGEGRRRLAFDELLVLQLAVFLKRRQRRETLAAPALKHSEAIDRHLRARFPFQLTPSQDQVISEIVRDVTSAAPMNRLVQGDVGSGKTVVALYAMLMAVASGHQAALMAPTELLAEQHYASICAMLTGGRVRIELLTGSLKPAARREIHQRLAAGEIDLLIGTHALLTETVSFHSLAVAVIDEQHRFGVHQRAILRTKTAPSRMQPGASATRLSTHSERRTQNADRLTPHVLVMTATPIPRTLSLTVFGDLDISTITGLPPGRQPIITKHVSHARAGEVYQYLAQRIDRGEQAYIVVPIIEGDTAPPSRDAQRSPNARSAPGVHSAERSPPTADSRRPTAALTDVQSHLNWLSAGPLAGKRLAAMHGRLKRDQREAIMHRFRNGEIDALIATTVIEVGVDVPSATMMVLEHADRFGLAQLHQLRGRIGRGGKRSLCVLIADPATEDGAARIDAVVSTSDGFRIAEKDLEIRGPGELFGARQSGLAPFLAADLVRDLPLLRLARRDAEHWVAENPSLAGQRDALLRKRLWKAHGKALGLGDVA